MESTPRANDPAERWIGLLGRGERPTDGVEDYCSFLGAALRQQSVGLRSVRVNWAEEGWPGALRRLWGESGAWTGNWVLVQFTTLAWSRRGFPLRLPKLIRSLKQRGARCAVVFHDPNPYPGRRMIDRVRGTLQLYVMRRALRLADLCVVTIPLEKTLWIPKGSRNVVFIPVGANLPAPERAWSAEKNKAGGAATVGVFSVSPDSVGREEVNLIAEAVRYAAEKTGKLRLVVVGRNSDEAGRQLEQGLIGTPVQVAVHGLLAGDEIVRVLGACHAMLFTRGQISSRRGSAIAGIACGLPIIAPEGSETAAPLTEAGVVLLPAGTRDEFGPALVRVLTDDAYRESLAERSRRAQERYFSWSAISAQYVKSLRETETTQSRGFQGARGSKK
jgi:glycosyltransferase involved in cell wall biosynthesis